MNRLIFYAIVLIIFITPIVHTKILPEQYELPKAIFFVMSTIFLTGFIAPTIKITHSIISEYSKNIKYKKIEFIFSIFILWISIASLTGGSWDISFWGQAYRYQGILFWCCGGILMMVISHHKKYNISINLLLKMIAFSGVTLGLLIISQWLLLTYFKWNIYTYNSRLSGFMGNANFAGGYLALSIAPISLLFPRFYRHLLCLIVVTLAIVLTESLSGCISAGGVCLIVYGEKMKHLYIYILGVCFVLILLLALLRRPPSSFDNRSTIWTKSMSAILSQPIAGWGWERFERGFASQLTESDFDLKHIRVDNAHNLWLNIATSSGIPGLLIYLALLAIMVKRLLVDSPNNLNMIILAMLVGFELYGSTNVIGVSQYVVWFILVGFVASSDSESPIVKA